jgi:hypothetical protein
VEEVVLDQLLVEMVDQAVEVVEMILQLEEQAHLVKEAMAVMEVLEMLLAAAVEQVQLATMELELVVMAEMEQHHLYLVHLQLMLVAAVVAILVLAH